MASNSSRNSKLVPEASEALNKFKYEVASDEAVKHIFKLFLTSSLSLATFYFLRSFFITFILYSSFFSIFIFVLLNLC